MEKKRKVWANGHHLFNQLLPELNNLRDSENDSLISSNTLEKCIHPLAVETRLTARSQNKDQSHTI